jgi:lipoprotein NlpD
MPVVEEKVVMEKGRFAWPVRGTVKTRFGIQPNKTYHNWIKITCPAGTRVKAAASGTVIFSANLKDFGETVIIRHANDFATVYTHLRKRSVRAYQDVGKGQTIGHAGRTDEAGETYFNFEIRIKGKARNPLFYLP